MQLQNKYTDVSIIEALNNVNSQCVINAGAGAGKTRFLCYKVANLLINYHFKPCEIIVCTFTEKAAGELKDRIRNILRQESPNVFRNLDIEELRIGTIHSIFQKLIESNISYSPYKSDIRVLDDLERRIFVHRILPSFNLASYTIPSNLGSRKTLFSFADLPDIIYEDMNDWDTTDYLCKIFDNIVDLGLDNCQDKIQNYFSTKIGCLLKAYQIYKEKLIEHNFIDFSQIQQCYWDMLLNDEFRDKIRSEIKYVLVDEYQDTNIIQERAIMESIGTSIPLPPIHITPLQKYEDKPITIVGDINQSLYRFRGAVIDNLLTFSSKFINGVSTYKLLANYRSNLNIINLANEYIRPNLEFYENNLGLNPDDFVVSKGSEKKDYPVITIQGSDRSTLSFVKEIHSFVAKLTNQGIIKLSDVAILLPSIRFTEADAFKEVFGDKIQFPLQIEFFYNELTRKILSGLAQFYGYTPAGVSDLEYLSYIKDICDEEPLDEIDILNLRSKYPDSKDLVALLYDIAGILLGDFRGSNELYYTILGYLSQLINQYLSLYQTADFNCFFAEYLPYVFLHAEDILKDEQPLDDSKAQLMTIHRSKGLEFPIVIVGYNKSVRQFSNSEKYLDPRVMLCKITHLIQIEDEENAPELELRRLFYVAFSRAKDLLIIGSREKSKIQNLRPKLFKYEIVSHDKIKSLLQDFHYQASKTEYLKPYFSYTKDIETYNLCPQMYAFIQKYGLVVPEENDFSFGKLVHKTIENINHKIISGSYAEGVTKSELFKVSEKELDGVLENMVVSEKLADQRNDALFQIKNYINYFYPLISSGCLSKVEQPVSYETDSYILNGRIDVIFCKNNNALVVDIKSGKKQNKSERDIKNFIGQIKLYGSLIKEKQDGKVELLIYSTGEHDFKDGCFPVEYKDIDEVYANIDSVINKIIKQEYSIDGYDLNDVCPHCPFSKICNHYKSKYYDKI